MKLEPYKEKTKSVIELIDEHIKHVIGYRWLSKGEDRINIIKTSIDDYYLRCLKSAQLIYSYNITYQPISKHMHGLYITIKQHANDTNDKIKTLTYNLGETI